MVDFRPAIAGLVAVCVLLLTPMSGTAADWDRFPELEPRKRVAIKKRFDGPRYNDLRSCYRRMDTRVGAKYFAVMVDITSETGSRSRKHSDAQPFAKAVAEAWQEEGKIDADRHVLIALGVRNRSVGIHPGQKWRKIGFDGEVIAETIDASHFSKHLRRRNYIDALCSLATAVDLRLANLEREMAKRIDQLQQRLPTIEERLTGLQERVDKRFDDEHPFGKKLRARLAAAQTKLKDARAELEDNPKQSVHLADEIEAILEEVPLELDTFNRGMSRLDEITKELDALEATIQQRPDVDWEQPQAALSKLAQCREKAAQIRETFEGEPWEVRDCQRDAEIHLGKADVHYFYLREVLPTLASILAVALIVWFVAARLLRRRRALGLLEADVDTWRRRLEDATRRLHQIEVAHPGYFAAGRAPWKGHSAELDQRVADPVNRMSLLVAKGTELLDEATRLRQKSHPLDVRRVEKALRLLRETSVDFEAGRVHTGQRLEVTLGDAYTGSASQLLGDLELSFERAQARLQDASDVVDRLDEQSSRAGRAATLATDAVDERRELGLSVDHLAEPLREATARCEAARRLALSDPATAADIFEQAADRLEELGQKATRGNEIVERIEGPIATTRNDVDQKVRKLRFARVNVDKLVIDPQRELDLSERETKRIIGLVAEAREDEAGEALDALQAALDQLERRLEVATEARDVVPEMLEELGARGKELKDGLMDVRYSLRRLAPDNNPDAFESVSKKLGKFHSRLHRLSKKLRQVKKLYDKQHYLLATEQIDSLAQLVERADTVLGEFGDIEQQVEQARVEAEQLLPQCDQLAQSLQTRADQIGVSATLRECVADQRVSFQMIRDQIRDEQAGWLEVRDRLVSMREVMVFLNEEMQADLSAYEQAKKLSARLGSQLDTLAQSASTPTEAQKALAQIRELAAGWASQVEEGSSGGRALLRTGREVAKAAGRAVQVSGPQALDLSVDAQLAYARARYAQIDGKSYGYGVAADCSPFAAEIDQAAAALEAGNLAGALELVEAAVEQIDLEDARADAAAERAYRKATVHNLDYQDSAPDARLPGQLGNHSSWGNSMATLSEPSGASP